MHKGEEMKPTSSYDGSDNTTLLTSLEEKSKQARAFPGAYPKAINSLDGTIRI